MGLAHRLTRDLFRAYDAAKRDQQRLNTFNDKWARLNAVATEVREHFVLPLMALSAQLSEKELNKLQRHWDDTTDWNKAIADQINDAQLRHLSQYATAIKRVTLYAANLCQKYSIFNDIRSVRYNGATKSILINEENCFYLG
jgi:hypothetical protein